MCDNIIIWNGVEIIGMLILCGIVLIGGIWLGILFIKEEIKEKRKKRNEKH